MKHSENKKVFYENKNYYNEFNKYSYKIGYIDFIKAINSINLKMYKIYDNVEILYAKIIDLYLIKRVLDKKYINNSLIYTGALHATNIVSILIKCFNFKITNSSVKTYSINEINNYVKNKKTDIMTDKSTKIFYPLPFEQCCNLKTFPKYFL